MCMVEHTLNGKCKLLHFRRLTQNKPPLIRQYAPVCLSVDELCVQALFERSEPSADRCMVDM